MIVIIDVDLDTKGNVIAKHTIDLGRTDTFTNADSLTPAVPMTVLQYLAWLQANKGKLGAHGWNQPTKLSGYSPGATRWQVLVSEANKAGADPAVKALGLT